MKLTVALMHEYITRYQLNLIQTLSLEGDAWTIKREVNIVFKLFIVSKIEQAIM